MKAIDQLLAKPVNRKQFLGHLGAGVLAVIGVPVLVRALHEMGNHQVSKGYGASPYGGAVSAQTTATTMSSSRPVLVQ